MFVKMIVGFVVPLAENRKGFPIKLTVPVPVTVLEKTSELSWKSPGLSLFAVNVAPAVKAPLKVTVASEALTGLLGDHPGPFTQVTVPLAVAFETVGYDTAVIATVCGVESALVPVGL